jgi:hypothetical protein
MTRRVTERGPVPTCDRLWTPAETAELLGVPIKTLHQWRYFRAGPPSFKVGRHLRYDRRPCGGGSSRSAPPTGVPDGPRRAASLASV